MKIAIFLFFKEWLMDWLYMYFSSLTFAKLLKLFSFVITVS